MEATRPIADEIPTDLLAPGRRVVTVTSKATHHHVTVRIHADDDVVKFTDYDGEPLATLERGGVPQWTRHAGAEQRWSIGALARFAVGEYPLLPGLAFIDAEPEP